MQKQKIRVAMVRHGRINPSDQALLEEGDPHADHDWLAANLPDLAATLKQFAFAAVFSGKQRRMTEMANELMQLEVFPSYMLNAALNAGVTYHEGVLYPQGVEEPMKAHMSELLGFCHRLYETYGEESLVLCLTSGARMAPMLALATRYEPPDEAAMMAWSLEDDHNPPLGAIWVFEYSPDDNSITKIDIDQALP